MVFSTQILGFLPPSSRRHGLAVVALGFVTLLSLTGCGQKGPLFLPVLRPSATTAPKVPPVIIVPVAPAPELP